MKLTSLKLITWTTVAAAVVSAALLAATDSGNQDRALVDLQAVRSVLTLRCEAGASESARGANAPRGCGRRDSESGHDARPRARDAQ